MKKSYLLTLMPAAIITTLSACNGGGSSNTFTPTALAWESCDPEKYLGITNGMISRLGDRLTCTKMVVPMDYSNPSRGTIEVALSKVSARTPNERKGSIFFNPGGPGASGIDMAPSFGIQWSNANPDDPLGAKFNQLSNEYDLIGFAPRGVASSTELICKQVGQVTSSFNFNESLTSVNNQYILYKDAELNAQVCQINELTPFINTDATARDMDLARSLLGDAKLSYIGYSYGSWLGTWYAGLFPNHVDKMVIDSNMDITISIPENGLLLQPKTFQNIADNIIAPYAALNESIFNLGSTQDVRNIYSQLNSTMQYIMNSMLGSTLYAQFLANDSVEVFAAAKGVNQLITDNPYANKDSIMSMVKDYQFSTVRYINRRTIIIAEEMTDLYFELIQQEPGLINSNGVFRAVSCNDKPSPTSFAEWLVTVNNVAISAPIFSTLKMNSNCTDKWGGSTVVQPSLDAMRSAPSILMVQTQNDGATGLEGALNTYNALGIASMVYVTNSYNHGVFNTIDNGCVDNAVTDYLLTGKLPENQLLVCQGQGLLPNMNNTASISTVNSDSVSFLPASLANKATYGDEVSTTNTFKDPKQAEEFRQKIQDMIINAEKLNR